MNDEKRPKIGLALGSGGSKGLAHIGVIKILESYGIPIDYIAGSSIGAFVGGFYAYRKNIREVEKIALSNNWREFLPIILDISLRHGLIKGEKVKKFIQEYIHNITFKDLIIPFTAVATNLTTSEPVSLNYGEVAEAIRASISVPLIFKPVEINTDLYIDGGLSMPVPVEAVKKMGADIVIAVNLNEDYSAVGKNMKYGFGSIAYRSIDIMSRYLSKENIKGADIVISPKVGRIGLFSKFLTQEGSTEVIISGEEAMKESIQKVNGLLYNESITVGQSQKLPDKVGNLIHNLKNKYTGQKVKI